MVQTIITAPSRLWRQFSKKDLRSKEVQTNGTLWETCDFICGSPECGRVTGGYGNYVTNLKKENEQLKARIAELEAQCKPTS
jgi:hypothetical protein